MRLYIYIYKHYTHTDTEQYIHIHTAQPWYSEPQAHNYIKVALRLLSKPSSYLLPRKHCTSSSSKELEKSQKPLGLVPVDPLPSRLMKSFPKATPSRVFYGFLSRCNKDLRGTASSIVSTALPLNAPQRWVLANGMGRRNYSKILILVLGCIYIYILVHFLCSFLLFGFCFWQSRGGYALEKNHMKPNPCLCSEYILTI